MMGKWWWTVGKWWDDRIEWWVQENKNEREEHACACLWKFKK
jgi:hypothetical protein